MESAEIELSKRYMEVLIGVNFLAPCTERLQLST